MTYEDSREVAEARVGSVLGGRWQLQRVLASGGSAWIYVARDQKTSQPSAIKILHSAYVAHHDIVRRFAREAVVSKMINHRCVVQTHGEGYTPEGLPFIAMELLHGENLDARRERKGGQLPVDEVMWAMDEVLGGLSAAHNKKVLHRDIKPENIFLTSQHTIKLLDFGIARVEDEAPNSERTRMGSLLGTPHFMAPEQGRGDWTTVGATSDLWAIGATMFTLLTGCTVHDEETVEAQLAAVATKPARALADYAPDVPRPVQFIVDQALLFDPQKRWLDASTMRIALRLAYREMKDDVPNSSRGGTGTDRGGRIPRPPLYHAPSMPPLSHRGSG